MTGVRGAGGDQIPRAAERARYLAALQGIPARRTPLDRALRLAVRTGFAVVGWRVRVEGVRRLPRGPDGRIAPCVIAAAPHRGWPDPFLVILAWPGDAPRLTWFGDEVTMTRSWWRRRLLPRFGMIPIVASPSPGAVETYLAAARVVLGRGDCLVVFPEKGPPSPRGSTRTIAAGAAWLALAGDVPIVPVAIGGFLETGLGTRFTVRFLAPLRQVGESGQGPCDEPGGERPRLAREGRALTARLTAALATPVAALEERSRVENRRRPMAGLRRVFR